MKLPFLPGVLAFLLGLTLLACQAQAPPPSPEAAAFKRDVQEILTRLGPALAAPLAQDDAQAVQQAILSLYPQAGQETDEFPFRVGVVDQTGILVAALPPPAGKADDFSQYTVVREALKSRRWGKARLFAPDGSTLWVIVAPVAAQRQLQGLVVLRLTAAQAKQKWGISEQEFLQLNLD